MYNVLANQGSSEFGFYKIRYHHDGKYNVMSMDGPFEVYGM